MRPHLEQAREGERTKVIIEPFVGFFDFGGLDANEIPNDIDNFLDAEAALISQMILILRRLARIREAAGRRAPLPRSGNIGRNDPCLATQERNTNTAAPSAAWSAQRDQKTAYN